MKTMKNQFQRMQYFPPNAQTYMHFVHLAGFDRPMQFSVSSSDSDIGILSDSKTMGTEIVGK